MGRVGFCTPIPSNRPRSSDIPFTIHDGDDGDRDYIKSRVVSIAGCPHHDQGQLDRLLPGAESPFNDYDDGQVITQGHGQEGG